MRKRKSVYFVGVICLGFSASLGFAAKSIADELTITALEPARHELQASLITPITIHFDRPVLRESVTPSSFRVFARANGVITGTFEFAENDTTVTLNHAVTFAAGQEVLVNLSHDLQAVDGSNLRAGGYAYLFTTRTARADWVFEPLQTISLRTGEPTRAYGGQACDFDGDTFIDIAVINEDTADIRVLLNRADGTGKLNGVLDPTTPSLDCASPNHAADFNGDGLIDIAAGSCKGSVSIVLGNGDGSFGPQQVVKLIGEVRGLATLDVDGDGDLDLCATSNPNSIVFLLINDGNGVFDDGTEFETGGLRTFALDSSDMNNDGIFDLLVGDILGEEVLVHLGNGDGTFTLRSRQDAGGEVWKIVCGDVNGDGNMDVSTANSFTETGAILIGDGTGNLAEPQIVEGADTAVATDLGDLDGDGDLDWVLSCFGSRNWLLYENDGSGFFTFDREFSATSNPACCLMIDLDKDRDLDLALIDEISDDVEIMANNGVPVEIRPVFVRGDCNQSDDFDVSDAVTTLLFLFDGSAVVGCESACDANGDDRLNLADATFTLGSLFTGGDAPPTPFPDCGEADVLPLLDCSAFPSCPQ